MTFSGIFAQFVALLGGIALQWRKLSGTEPAPAWGEKPAIPEAKPQGTIPTLKMPTARGWSAGQKPSVAPGLQVNAFATGLDHPRWIEVLPNGDVLIAEATQIASPPRTVFHYAMQATMRRAAALGVSANRITLLRDRDGDGVAEVRGAFMENLRQPFGMALVGDTFYVGNTDGVMAFPYVAGADRITAPGKRLTNFKPGGHWTRSLLASPDGKKLYAGVGSLSNIAEMGMEVEQGRAAIYELDLAAGAHRIFAAGLRNPVGLAWEPTTGVLWTVVNERDGLGDETPPDYLTSVRDGGFYGWPYCYWGKTVDDRVPQDPAMVAKALQPDYALGGHTASLGLCWMPAGTLPGFPDGMVIGQHGSWNRSKLSGYKVVFIPFENGRPSGPARDILSGFLAPDEKESYGRPVGVAIGPDKSLLMADDVGNVIWRVTGA
ncbi:sorbosone dehydrogenase family protein [Bradyrhizobium sp. 182]|uniref:PQQ-dependent sugar dehydrogenase n=1 Tax=unclassified Bradyrhizobium TaxID=2631580 RepID=UPI001FF7B481|nr:MULTISPECIES: sorbosone dehydrogenase family protein [unclassified Bradyrhizobium]MCK1422088.1 sorbosone dehydrogenase family protein [Bradyrhizobium sp. CW12]MCK1528839.1 sorbosone dehydrogenase family protein [Bradyrhizobium sp. 182]MCK1598079.1 sorbosone dehydrogenase family protein [Bradyrhizobium sp. 164]MCK1648680.1 sorbosone dehydrogenase family protein [Bradyrhizobium sp. 154]MCK1666690.1 sorbosone dehydrogenase family protein [Bradyrhizobium sp. 153]